MQIAVGYASKGRPDILSQSVLALAAQSRRPDHVFISVTCAGDVDSKCLHDLASKSSIIYNDTPGLCAQRNAVIDRAAEFDLIVFFDDDFIMHRQYLQMIEQAFANDQSVQLATGTVVADGAPGRGLTLEEAVAAIQAAGTPEFEIADAFSAYGCNMAIRLQTAFERKLRFDERLPLYGWLEDLGFSRSISKFGRIVRVRNAIGAHLGVKQGRVSGKKYGYSQVSNPIQLLADGLIPPFLAAKFISKNLAANGVKSLYPEPWIDRRGRLMGNLIAIRDALVGRLDPRRVLGEL